MIRFIVIRARQSGDKNNFLINGRLNVCLLWGIGHYDTTPQLGSANCIHHGWDPIWLFLLRGGRFNCRLSSLTHSLSRPKKDSMTERPGVMAPLRQFSFVGCTSGPGR